MEHRADDAGHGSERRSAEHGVWLAVAGGALLLLPVLRVFAEPDPRGHGTHEQFGLPACGSIEWLGVPCPGCGVTTSVALASRGELFTAFLTQPFGLLVAGAAPVFGLWALVQHVRGRDLSREMAVRFSWRVAGLLFALLAVAWAWKIRQHWTGS